MTCCLLLSGLLCDMLLSGLLCDMLFVVRVVV